MKLTNSFICVPAGEIYPREIEAGSDCPPEHEDSAHALGCIDDAEYEAGVALRPQADEQEPSPEPGADRSGESAPKAAEGAEGKASDSSAEPKKSRG